MLQTGVNTLNGAVFLDKVPGITSFSALFPLKRLYGNSLGHTGTLDSFAEGLLVALVGKLTKLAPLLTVLDKVYEADFLFGAETATLDPEGEIIFSAPVPVEKILEGVDLWKGVLQQVPPNYSAVHVQGKRASDRVRAGQVLDLPSRTVEVFALDVLNWTPPRLSVRIHCSKGTYIRSIARDWGRWAGCGAHVVRLKRTQVGPFSLTDAQNEQLVSPIEVLNKLSIPQYSVGGNSVSWIQNGRDPLSVIPGLALTTSDSAGLLSPTGKLMAMVERLDDVWRYRFVDRDCVEKC